MLVKVKEGIFINTDYIVSVDLWTPTEDGTAIITIDADPPRHIIPIEAASYLLEIMEAKQAVILPGEPGYINYTGQDPGSTQPLTSRVAQLLRDTMVQGATVEDITQALHETYNLVDKAIFDLVCERVVIGDAITGRYYHATHAPGKAAPQPERDIERVIMQSINALDEIKNNARAQIDYVRCVTCGEPPSASMHDPDFGTHAFGKPIGKSSSIQPQGVALPEWHDENALPQFTLQAADQYKSDNPIVTFYCPRCGNSSSEINCLNCGWPATGNPDPSAATVTPPALHPAANSANSASLTSSGLCSKCGYLLTSQTHLNSCEPLAGKE